MCTFFRKSTKPARLIVIIFMKSIYLIWAKTNNAVSCLEKEGAIKFSSDTYLWDQDPLSPQRLLNDKQIPVGDVVVLDIFVPNSPNHLQGDHENKKQLEKFLVDLYRVAFFWSRKYENQNSD